MITEITIKVPDLEDSGLTEEARETLVVYLQELKDQYNEQLALLDSRITALENP